MVNEFKMDFGLFFRLFFEKAFKNGYTVPSIICAIFDEKINDGDASSYKTGSKGIPYARAESARDLTNAQIADRFQNILTGKKRQNGIMFDETIYREILESCASNIISLTKLAKLNILSFRNPQLVSTLEDDSINLFSKIAYLFSESLPLRDEKYISRSDQYYKEILDVIYGDYFPSMARQLPDCYCNCYNIYYFSEHYEDEVHCGLLRIYKGDNNRPLARFIYGLTSCDKMQNESLLNALNASNTTEAKMHFEDYLRTISLGYDKRVFMMNGIVDSTDYSYYLKINFTGTGKRSNDFQTLYLNVSRVSQIQSPGYKYHGGLGIIIAAPYKTTPKIRVHRIGVADTGIKISLKDETLKRILQLMPTDKHRLQVQMDDDREFWNFLLKCEAEALVDGPKAHNPNP